MRKHTVLAWIVSLTLTVSLASVFPVAAADTNSAESATDWIEGEAIVLTSGMPLLQGGTVSTEETVVHTATFDLQPETGIEELPLLGSAAAAMDSISVSLVRSETETTEELIARLEQQPNVVCAEPNWKIETRSVTDHQDFLWALENRGQNGGTPGLDMNIEALENTLTETEAVIAVVDTGINFSHPDLQPYLWKNPYAESGELEGLHGYDYVNWDDDPTDDHGHGTHCAGIIASVLEQANVDNVKIMGLKILDDGGSSGIYSEIAAYEYIYDAQNLGVNVTAINNSWGGSLIGAGAFGDIMNLIMTLVGQRGALSLCAAGNDGVNVDDLKDYPSGLDNPYIISVAATDESDNLANFSNYGVETVDLAAPGVNILSTYFEPYFEPSAFSEEQKAAWIALSEDFSASVPALVDADKLSDGVGQEQLMLSYGTPEAEQSLTLSQDVYFGTPEQGSALCWEYTVPEDGAAGKLYLPLPDTVTEEEMRDFCIRFKMETEDTGCNITVLQNTLTESGVYGDPETESVLGNGTYEVDKVGRWNTIISNMAGIDGEMQALVWQLDGLTPGGKVRIYLDDFYISTVNDGTGYPQYAYMNGTSMATPYVTAAAGLLALRNPEADALEIATDLLCCTRPVEQLNGLVKTGGVLDFLQLESDRPCVLDSSLNTETGELTLMGRNLNNITSYSHDTFADVQTISCTDTESVLDVSDYERCFLNITFYDGNNHAVYQTKQYYPTGTLPEIIASISEQGGSSLDDTVFYLNGIFYRYDFDGWLYQLDMTEGWILLDSNGFPAISDIVPDAANFYTVSDHQLYVIVDYPMPEGVTKQILCYDFEQGSWSECGFPQELTQIIDVTAGDGILWLVGQQYDTEKGIEIPVLCQYDPNTKETIQISEMPSDRMAVACHWMTDELVLTMDVLPDEKTLKPLPQIIYNPAADSWRTCGQMTFEQIQTLYYDETSYLYPFAGAANSRYLVYAGMGVQGAGDIILYDTQTNQYLSTKYSIYDLSQQYYFKMVASEDMLYFLSANETGLESYSDALELQVRGVSFEALAASATPIIQLGDADEDGVLAVEDAVAILTAYARNSAALECNFTASQKRLADVDFDGNISVEDAVSVLTYYARKSAGLDASF